MIKLNKLKEPQILTDNKRNWTSQYVRLIKTGQTVPESLKYRYREPDIKKQIMIETNNKCAYCESKVSHVCPGDVEHILPKNKDARPDLYVEWSNLTLSCEECNRTRKSDYYDPSDPLIDPYKDDPANHLMPVGPLIYHKPGDRKGLVTETILELNRSGLFERRVERIKNLVNLSDKWASETNPSMKKALEEELKKEATEDKEYIFVVKGYLRNIGLII